MRSLNILGVKINKITLNDALKVINRFVLENKPKQITTVNPEFIMTAQKDQEFFDILNKSDLSVPDGYGILFASKHFLNENIKERVAGIDLMYGICRLAEKNRYPIYLLGAAPGIAQKTAKILINKYPDLIISGYNSASPNLNLHHYENHTNFRMNDIKPSKNDPNLEIIKTIRRAKPKILFVAYGAPKQDKFIYRYKKQINVPIMMGVGGSFDFIAGKAKRAPVWMQKIGLEWLWRVFTEPWRFQRIVTATVKFPLAVMKCKTQKS